MIPPPGPVEPGTPAHIVVVVRNDSAVVDSFRLEVLGADGWITADPDELSLFPDTEGTSRLVVLAPRSSAVVAGTHRVGVRVTSNSTGVAVVEEADIVVSPFEAVGLRLRPTTARARRRARFTALVSNEGNIARRFWFDGDDDDDLLRYRIRPTHAHLEPGEARNVRISGIFLSFPNPGDRVPVTVTAGNDATSSEAKGTVAVRQPRAMRALGVLGALAVVAGVLVMIGRDGTPTSSATVATLAPTTTPPPPRERATTTAVAETTTTTTPPTTVAASTTTTTVVPPTTEPPQKDPETVQPPASTTTTSVPPTTTTTPSPITVIRFDTPVPVKGQRDQLLVGDEFAAQGVTFLGAPSTTTFCAGATRTALLASNEFGAPSPFLTTTTGDLRECNNVPVGIRFTRPVKRVKLTIWGASVNYVLRARNVKGTVVASAIVTPTCCKTPKTVEVKGSLITDVTFGLDKSITAVTQIEYEV
jgi:hypothetical protein